MKKKQLIRLRFSEDVFKRDNHTCKFCDRTDDLDAHHITDRNEMPHGGYVLENGISLCPEHHMMAERFHISGGKEWEENMHPNDLYELIGSSYEKAVEESERKLK